MRVILTRPQREAARWTLQLRERGFSVESLPLIDIAAAPDDAPLQAAWRDLAAYSAVMFVSRSAVEHFFAQRPADMAAPWPSGKLRPRAWAPGPGTRKALLAEGVPATDVDAPAAEAPQFDSEALWQQVAGQPRSGSRVLLVRGAAAADAGAEGAGTGRDWLSARLVAAGASVEPICAYVRRVPVLDASQAALAAAAALDGSVWIFSSSEAAANLQRLLPGQRWSGARAVATHPRIALTLEAAGFGVVCRSRPAESDIVAALESFQ